MHSKTATGSATWTQSRFANHVGDLRSDFGDGELRDASMSCDGSISSGYSRMRIASDGLFGGGFERGDTDGEFVAQSFEVAANGAELHGVERAGFQLGDR